MNRSSPNFIPYDDGNFYKLANMKLSATSKQTIVFGLKTTIKPSL